MEKKLTLKQQKFVYKYLETGNASEAYRHAYSTENMSTKAYQLEACRLLGNPSVSLAIKKLQEEAQQIHQVTIASITQELEDARLLGMTEKQISAAVRASLGKAKLHGLVIDKSVVKVSPLEGILKDIDGQSTGLPKD